MRSEEVAVVVGRGDVVMTIGEVSSSFLNVMCFQFSSWR